MTETGLERRSRLMGPNMPTFYDTPVELVRGEGVWLWDAQGRRYLDAYNNVPHLGHCHPRVVTAVNQQMARLNTHNRYLHNLPLDYAERLMATLSGGPHQILFTCTGSEANDVALRMAQAVTGKRGIIATDNTYHGNSLATSQLSTRRPPIGGYPGHIRLVPAPDSLHPLGGSLDAQPQIFANNIAQAIAELEEAGIGFGAMMLCPVFANEGLPNLAPGFFDPAAQVIRDAGGLILCDEVQPGFGRLGSHFWGHDWLGFVPDVITTGKPMANGYPMASVITKPEVMAAFRSAFGYFNTFAGTPVAAAAAMAVLDVLEDEQLQANAAQSGAAALARLQDLRHPLIKEIRGKGLFFGVVFEHADQRPARGFTQQVVESMRNRGVLLNAIGRDMNILKFRPPMPFGLDHVDLAMNSLEQVLAELPYDP